MFGPEWDKMAAEQKEEYVRVVRGMTGVQRIMKACELSETVTQLAILGIRHQHPGISETEVLKHLARRKLPAGLAAEFIKHLESRE